MRHQIAQAYRYRDRKCIKLKTNELPSNGANRAGAEFLPKAPLFFGKAWKRLIFIS